LFFELPSQGDTFPNFAYGGKLLMELPSHPGPRSDLTFDNDTPHPIDLIESVTVMRRSRSRVGGLVLLPHFIEHLLPQLHNEHVM
jgi:hypothetical protein